MSILEKIKPVDVIAAIVIIGSFILKILGADGTVSLILTSVCFYYFGKQGRAPIDSYDKTSTAGGSN